MNPFKNKKGILVKRETFVSQDTGEIIEVQSIAMPDTEYDKDFHKVWFPLLMKVLTNMGGSKMKALAYILENINPHNNEFAGTIREIVDATGLSQTTIQETIKLLILHGFFIKIRPSNYMVNPNYIMKGNSRKHRNLLLRYTKFEGETSSAASFGVADTKEQTD